MLLQERYLGSHRTLMNYLLTGQETDRLTFRPVTDVGFDDWLPLFHQADTGRMLGLGHLNTAEEQCAAWFGRAQQRIAERLGGLSALYTKDLGQLVGQCGLLVQQVDGIRELEVGYSLLPQYRGQGYALEAAGCCRDIAFQKGYTESLISIIHVENRASKQVALRNGMQLSKTTEYKGFPVDVFRISKDAWEQIV